MGVKLRVGSVIDCDILDNAYILDMNNYKILLRDKYSYHKWYDTKYIRSCNPKLRIEEYYIFLLRNIVGSKKKLGYTVNECVFNNNECISIKIDAESFYAQSKNNTRNMFKPEIILVRNENNKIDSGYLMGDTPLYIDGEIDIPLRRKIINYCNKALKNRR